MGNRQEAKVGRQWDLGFFGVLDVTSDEPLLAGQSCKLNHWSTMKSTLQPCFRPVSSSSHLLLTLLVALVPLLSTFSMDPPLPNLQPLSPRTPGYPTSPHMLLPSTINFSPPPLASFPKQPPTTPHPLQLKVQKQPFRQPDGPSKPLHSTSPHTLHCTFNVPLPLHLGPSSLLEPSPLQCLQIPYMYHNLFPHWTPCQPISLLKQIQTTLTE